MVMHALDHEARALWHLELLGCFEPGDAVAPWDPETERSWWDDHDHDHGEGIVVFCCDDICRGQGYCMHGDGDSICRDCGGEGAI